MDDTECTDPLITDDDLPDYQHWLEDDYYETAGERILVRRLILEASFVMS
jgi:hypothetical protein